MEKSQTLYIAYSAFYGILGVNSTKLKAAQQCARCYKDRTGHKLDEKNNEQLIQNGELKVGDDYLCIEKHRLDVEQ